MYDSVEYVYSLPMKVMRKEVQPTDAIGDCVTL